MFRVCIIDTVMHCRSQMLPLQRKTMTELEHLSVMYIGQAGTQDIAFWFIKAGLWHAWPIVTKGPRRPTHRWPDLCACLAAPQRHTARDLLESCCRSSGPWNLKHGDNKTWPSKLPKPWKNIWCMHISSLSWDTPVSMTSVMRTSWIPSAAQLPKTSVISMIICQLSWAIHAFYICSINCCSFLVMVHAFAHLYLQGEQYLTHWDVPRHQSGSSAKFPCGRSKRKPNFTPFSLLRATMKRSGYLPGSKTLPWLWLIWTN